MSVNLLEMLQSQLGSGVIQQASKFLGEDESKASSAMSAILPSILGSALQHSGTPNGATGIMDMLSKNNFDGGMFNNLGNLFGGGNATSGLMNAGSGVLKMLMGNKTAGLIDIVTSMTGMKKNSSSSMLSMAAPLVMSMIGKVVKSKGLNAGGLVKMLMGQSKFIQDAVPSQISDMMGFGNLGSNMMDKIGGTAKAAGAKVTGAASAVGGKVTDTAAATAAAGGGFGKKLLTWGLPVLLVLGALYMFRACGDNPISDAAGGALDTVTETAGAVADKAGDAAGAVAEGVGDAAGKVGEVAGDVAEGVGDVAGSALATLKANAAKALEGVKFAAGSVGEKFSNLLSGDEDPVGKSFAFDNLTFASGSADISGDSKMEVENLAAVLNAYTNIKVEVQGHTDNTGDAAKNKTLSQQRADAVKAMLEGLGIDASRITSMGFGADEPVADNGTADGRKMNRRTAVKVTGS